MPVSARGAASPERLIGQARAIETEASRRVEAAKAAQDPRERLEAVFGRGFRVLPLVRPPNAADIGKALGASKKLLGGDPLEALSWLQGVSRVRPGASRLSGALAYAAALGRKPALELKVAQLPFVAGERWVALKPEPGKAFPVGKISLVAHLPRPFKPAQPLAGLMLDEWTETVPEPEVTTGLAFNYDAPGARPPQAVLLAVAPPGADAGASRRSSRRCWRRSSSRSSAPSTRRRSGATRCSGGPCRRSTSAPTSQARRSRRTSPPQARRRGRPSFPGRTVLHRAQDRAVAGVPSITFWTRIEPFSRRDDIDSGLQARTHDPLWLLARQWQTAEFQGEDAGTPVQARLRLERSPLARFRPGPNGAKSQPYRSDVPLEALVEREPVQRTNDPRRDLRVAAEAASTS